jgi:hypothetical protein
MIELLLIVTLLLPIFATSGQANLVPDPSFESGTATWTLGDAACSIDNSVARTGSRSMKLVNDGSATNHNAGQSSIGGIQAGVEYTYSVWVQASSLVGVGAGGKPLAVLRWRDSSDTRIEKEMYMWAPYGTYGWRRLSINLQAPPDATKVDVFFRSWWDCLSGTSHWDDAVLEPRDLSYRGNLAGTFQAETASATSGGGMASTETNYTGSGYFKPQSDNAYVEWNNVSGGSNGGTRILSFRYALEGNEKNWEVFVNGISQGTVRPSATGRINSWASSDWEVTLQPGNNTVRVQVLTVTSGPIIDKLDVYNDSGGTPTAGTPTITPNGGTFTNSVQVSLQTVTAGATIYYTTDSSTPTSGSAQYSSPITLTNSATVRAMAVASDYANSAVASAVFTKSVPAAATPSITPNGGTFDTSVQVSLQASTPGADIYYTLNGDDPTSASTQYTGPITLTNSATVKAMAVASDYTNSTVASAVFTKSDPAAVATPTITPNGGTSFTTSVQVSLQTSTPGADIYYTLNGDDPTSASTQYTGPFTLYDNATVKALAVAAGYNDSAVASADFAVTVSGLKPFGGLPWTIPGTIEAEDYDAGGEGVAYHDTTADNSGGQYRTDDVDIWLLGGGDVNYYTGANAASEWLTYTVNVDTGGTYSLDLRVATPKDGRQIHVEIDGIDITGQIDIPNTGSWNDWQTVMTTVNLSQGEHVLQVAFDLSGINFDWMDINPIGNGQTAAMPTATPDGGAFTGSVDVVLETTTPGATIYYTMDGSTPTNASTPYTEPITLTSDATINAIATAIGYSDSTVASVTFTQSIGPQQDDIENDSEGTEGTGGGSSCFISSITN